MLPWRVVRSQKTMSDTEQLFLMAAIWALIAAVIARFIPNWPGRIAFLVIAVGIPFWELPYGYYNFKKLCSEQGTLQVLEKIAPQDSVCVSDLDAGLYSGFIRAGFSRIEVTGRSDDPRRDTVGGRVFQTKKQDVKSRYCIGFRANIALPWRILRHDVLIVRAEDERVAARQSQFHWSGMWWQEQAHPVLGRGGVCFDDPQRPNLALRNGTS